MSLFPGYACSAMGLLLSGGGGRGDQLGSKQETRPPGDVEREEGKALP